MKRKYRKVDLIKVVKHYSIECDCNDLDFLMCNKPSF